MQIAETKTNSLIDVEKVSVYHWFAFGICFLCDLFGGMISTLMSVYLPVVAKTLLGNVNETELGEVGAYINALYIFGWMFGGVVWGLLSDKIGRARVIILSVFCYAVFTVFTGFGMSWKWIVVCRFLSGFGVGGVLVVTTTFISEIWKKETRAIVIGVLSIAFPIGIFSAGLINIFIEDWKDAFMIGVVPLLISTISLWTLRESEKWKAAKDDKETGKLKMLFNHDHRGNLFVGALTFGTMLIGLWAIFSWLPTWVQSLLGATNGQQARGISMMLMGGGGLLGGFLSGWIANAIGLRKTMIVCFSGCFVLSFLLFKLNTSFSHLVYVEIACLALFFGVSQGALSAYIPQLFPASIRATGTGLCFNIGRLVTATAVFFVGALVVFFGGYGNAIFAFSLVFLIGLATIVFSKSRAKLHKQIISQPTD
jgi:MFS family permease